MAPKVAPQTRIAADGSIEQYCKKGSHWKPQLPDFKAARGNNIVETCQTCRDNVKSNTKARRGSSLARDQDNDDAQSVTSSTIVVDDRRGEDIAMGEAEEEAGAGPVCVPIYTHSNHS
jgi:hypothetical protein